MSEGNSDDLDREAILRRRQRFIGRALERIDRPSLRGSKTKLMVAAMSGLATACPRPCLTIIDEPAEESSTGTAGDETDGTETNGTETTGETGTETGETGTETGETGTETGETGTDTGTDSAM